MYAVREDLILTILVRKPHEEKSNPKSEQNLD